MCDDLVLTAAHVVAGADDVRVRFAAGKPTGWTAPATVDWTHAGFDVAILRLELPENAPPAPAVRFGRFSDDHAAAVVPVSALGFPRWKRRIGPDERSFRDTHLATGTVALLSNSRTDKLEISVTPPRDDESSSPWEGMSGAAVWTQDRIVGLVVEHHAAEGPGHLTAVRLDKMLTADGGWRTDLADLLGMRGETELRDVVPRPTGWLTMSGYRERAQDLAPTGPLRDRDAELSDLAVFCAGREPYMRWQGEPWAGKTALMSTFVLDPPAGVEVVSFFVTARMVAQADSNAFTDALLEQLAILADEMLPPDLTPAARDNLRRALLRNAAERVGEAGRRLVLVVDGLDEDQGAVPGSPVPSIASLLPKHPPGGVRIILASRPDPPIPTDVPPDHPIRTCPVRTLSVSPHAQKIESLAQRELDEVLVGYEDDRNVIGMITAAGGGLSVSELEQLTGRGHADLVRMLCGVFGRTIARRTNPDRVHDEVLTFTHESLRVTAVERLGEGLLASLRERVHRWADEYRMRRWPPDTPTYLLRSYPLMLRAQQDWVRLADLAADRRRHHRLLELTGGDAAALADIKAAQDLILSQPEPDLGAMAVLASVRSSLVDRNMHIPVELPALWVRIGNHTRGESLAHSISDPDPRTTGPDRGGTGRSRESGRGVRRVDRRPHHLSTAT